MSSFLRDIDFYTSDAPNVVSNYYNQMATGLSIEFGISKEEALNKIHTWRKEGRFKDFQNPRVEFFTKDENDDRIHGSSTVLGYINNCVKERHILVPTFTAYYHPDVRQSPISAYVGDNVQKRALAKKASQQAYTAKDFALGFLKDVEQKNKKENNNSLSGLFSAESSIFVNDTGHNTLTSITRSMASVANALNERIIGGNRHYRDLNSAINNTLAIIESTDLNEVKETLSHYGLRSPTVDELMEVYRRSMRFYNFDITVFSRLKQLVKNMSPEQRSVVAYSQDLYHIKKFNPSFVRDLLTNFSRAERDKKYEDPVKVIRACDELTLSFAHQVCLDEMRGKGKDHSKVKPDTGERVIPIETTQLVANVCENIQNNVKKYDKLFKTFFLTKTVPNNTAFIQDMVRTSVVLSDTDSTMFSVDQWVLDYFGKLDFTSKGFAIAGTVAFISSQVNAHCIAILSGNMNVSRDKIFTLSMKPEFAFPVFIQSPVSKHYFTAKLVCEGNVYEKLDMEIKGVHNRNSAISDAINAITHARMESTIEKIMRGEKISMREEVKSLVEQEQSILKSLQLGHPEFFKRTSIKSASTYSVENPERNSIYAFHTLWKRVFAPVYGDIPEPEYDVIKVPTTLTSKTKFNKWLDSLPDAAMAERFRDWMVDHGKVTLKTLYFSLDQVEAAGLPVEVTSIVDYTKIVIDTTYARRMMLDSFGLTPRPGLLQSTFEPTP